MTPERWVRVREIFAAALAEPPDRRSAFLGDGLRRRPRAPGRGASPARVPSRGGKLHRATRAVRSDRSRRRPRRGDHDPGHERTIGGYRILRRIGEGGMGIVYEAEQEHPRRRVALKVIRGGLADERRLRLFEREMQALARLRHPAIAAIYQAGQTDDGQPFFAMELVARRDPGRGHSRERAGRGRPRRAHVTAASVREGLRGRQLRASARRRAPRPQARQHPGRARTGERRRRRPARGQDPRLRPGPGHRPRRRLLPAHPGRRRAGHARLHEPGAGARQPRRDRPPHGRVFPRASSCTSWSRARCRTT